MHPPNQQSRGLRRGEVRGGGGPLRGRRSLSQRRRMQGRELRGSQTALIDPRTNIHPLQFIYQAHLRNLLTETHDPQKGVPEVVLPWCIQ